MAVAYLRTDEAGGLTKMGWLVSEKSLIENRFHVPSLSLHSIRVFSVLPKVELSLRASKVTAAEAG